MLDTRLGKVLGGAAALAAAVLLYRAVNRVFIWIYWTRVFGVGVWLATTAGGILLIFIAGRLWSRWRLVLGSALLIFSAWSIIHRVPAIHRAARAIPGYYADRFDLVNTWGAWCTVVVLTALGVVALGREAVTAAIHRHSKGKKLPTA